MLRVERGGSRSRRQPRSFGNAGHCRASTLEFWNRPGLGGLPPNATTGERW